MTQAHQLLVLAWLLRQQNMAVKEALLGPAHEPVTLIPSALVFQLSVELQSRQAGLKGTMDKQLERDRDPCSWSDLAAECWGNGNGPWSFSLANCCFFLSV